MKKIIFLSFILGLLILNISCKKDETPTTGKATLNVKKFASSDPQYANKIIPASASISGCNIELHSKATFDAKVASAVYSGAAASFGSLAKGKYYAMAWKDNDSNNAFSDGDFFGFVDKALTVNGGESFNFTIEMYVLKN